VIAAPAAGPPVGLIKSPMEALPDKCTITLRAGDVLRMLTPGGGGWGTAAGQPSAAMTVSESM